MILFTILFLIFIFLMIVSIAILSVGGTFFIVIFGDLIVCAFIIVLIMKWLRRKKK